MCGGGKGGRKSLDDNRNNSTRGGGEVFEGSGSEVDDASFSIRSAVDYFDDDTGSFFGVCNTNIGAKREGAVGGLEGGRIEDFTGSGATTSPGITVMGGKSGLDKIRGGRGITI